MIDPTVDNVWPDGPSGSPFNPPKSLIRSWGRQLESAISSLEERSNGNTEVWLITGQSRAYIERLSSDRAFNARVKEWNNTKQDEGSVGAAFVPLSTSHTQKYWEVANNFAKANPGKDVYLIRVPWGSKDITHWTDGAPYTFDSSTGSSDAGTGKVWLNNAAPASATRVYLSEYDRFRSGRRTLFSWVEVGHTITVTDGSGNFYKYTVTAVYTDSGTFGYFDVSYAGGAGTVAGDVRVKASPDLRAMIRAVVPAALAKTGVDRITRLWWDQGDNDAGFNQERYPADFEEMMAWLVEESWMDESTPVVIAGMPPLTGFAYYATMDATLQQVAAAAPSTRTFVSMWSLRGPSYWADSNNVHETAAGQIAAGNLLYEGVYGGARVAAVRGLGVNPADGSQFFTSGTAIARTLRYDDDGAGVGPIINYRRFSSTPAPNDGLATLQFQGQDDSGSAPVTWTTYASISATLVSPTDGAESGGLNFNYAESGALAVGMQLRGPSSGQTAMLLRVNRAGSLSISRVLIGAENSGGAGFRQLIVAN